MVPTEDVCAKCESLRDRLRVEFREQGKLDITKCLKEHVKSAQAERAFYNSAIEVPNPTPSSSTLLSIFQRTFVHLTIVVSRDQCISKCSCVSMALESAMKGQESKYITFLTRPKRLVWTTDEVTDQTL